MYNDDTIAAISTPQGTGGIGIIRISGSRAFEIAGRIFSGKKAFDELKSHTISYGKIIDPSSSETIDEVLVSKMNKPNTFTREDVVEINCHGGLVVLKRVLELVIREGARLAEPGEFTKRAFLNGRIDLSQAEAVIDIINSKTLQSSRAAMDQLEGKLSRQLKKVRDHLIELLAHMEVNFDYPEYDVEEITGRKVYDEAGQIRDLLEGIMNSFEKGRILREGISAVIVGRPNVGKSSLLNELSGKSRAIVTDIPGTTRDIIEEYVNINGIPVKMIDTAGIRETDDVVEKIGVERAQNAIENSDLVIVMIDAGVGISEEDMEILEKVKGKKTIVLINKVDLADKQEVDAIADKLAGFRVIRTSVKNEKGIDDLEKEITDLFMKGGISLNSEVIITNIRHKDLIAKAIQSIDEARGSYENGMPLDLIAIDIKNAAEFIGQITGESVSDDVIHEIFKNFCLGK
ncbi:tRNA uridine-5-carboxymethylaminomethyl(34) synthesis GTPase MnmE [Clostridium thermosuccinogenes]|uniref:tRNA modification GTPase MnmE n=1 Tax=Clostridium thermosuccinogenes TaxID=84032 RepID=A0A2K2F962_9CLOT|nr:tRNA uridine-5-carboxymethylaminomethyl(34) synthesis GTPase MnmE [Pseudoclostridium thermosuccinogenes]AUS98503.1 tRNA uridine-5-carboxymethylaminomethyl(34) synthesis GTPase MnmE [Pseudoclostridium thermosuccinogenes]PNT94755.1 tRNA uridine-5-carboxymethylaminomethyl(34) synthesis GTPase MnmE [Pseudoclostridium thermosuccinogenes]PNT95332.1 tRNA uridine-5-carboxymethylaminomethyl(34) synthesis GTPase MnmE [Pseudoclostridium thermosuccinogenes]